MDIRARRDDPQLEELARSIYALFPRCMKCGVAIPSFEEADVRVLTNRVVHRSECAPSDNVPRTSPDGGDPS